MSALIKELEAAERPSRALDVEIAIALGADAKFFLGTIGYKMRNAPWVSYDTSRWVSLPDFTSSFDEATKIVPKGASVHAHIFRHHDKAVSEVEVGAGKKGRSIVPAIAVCIAALKSYAWIIERNAMVAEDHVEGKS